MLLSLKTRSGPLGSRTVPNGGLGGCVVISPSHTPTGTESVWDGSRSYQHSNKSSPNRLFDLEPTQHATNKLQSRLDAPLPATPVTPLCPRGLSVMIAGEDGSREWPAMQTWPVDEGVKWNRGIVVMEASTGPRSEQCVMPVELPGSLLLPSQGFAQTIPPSAPPRPFRQFRVNDSKSSFDTVPSLTNSCESSPESGSFSPSTLRSHLHKRLPALPSVDDPTRANSPPVSIEYIVTRTVDTSARSFTSINARELLLSLRDLREEQTAKQWMTAMEQELSCLREWTDHQASQRATSLVTMSLFFKELRGILDIAREICRTHDVAFQRVQASFDMNRQTHAVKLERVEITIRDMLARLQDKVDAHGQALRHEEVAVLLTFRQSIDVLSKFVQSQLVYQLRQRERGLGWDLAERLRTFDDNHRRAGRCRGMVEADMAAVATTMMTTVTKEWVQFEDLEVELQRTQEMLQEAQRTLKISHDELQNTAHNYDEAITLADRYQTKLNKCHNEADAIRNKLLAQHDARLAGVSVSSSQSKKYHGNYNYLSQVTIPRSRMTWDHGHPPTMRPSPVSPTSTSTSTPTPTLNTRYSMSPKMCEIHTGIDDLIRRLQSQTNQISSLSDQVAHLRDDNAVLNRQNTSLSQEICARDAHVTESQHGAHLVDVAGKAKSRLRQLKLKLHCGTKRAP